MISSASFTEESKNKIIIIHDVTPHDKYVKAIITTSYFKRITTRPYKINNAEWAEIVLRGWI